MRDHLSSLASVGIKVTTKGVCSNDKPPSIRVFHKLDEIGNSAIIGIRGFTT